MHPGDVAEPPPPLDVQPFVAERARYMKEEAHFCPTEWLPVFEAASYIEPRLLARDRPLDHGPPPMKQSGQLEELVKFAEDLDSRIAAAESTAPPLAAALNALAASLSSRRRDSASPCALLMADCRSPSL